LPNPSATHRGRSAHDPAVSYPLLTRRWPQQQR
jgi:hypothetical protein